ncbi:hypothetical protein BTR23_22025 [Alkalihalophilus pseudofirmus]|nr:hypothetical protein BTR23_22025 [Alkalihalophilus pseudofirmus]
MVTTGTKIKELREKKGLSQEDLAEKLNFAKSIVWSYEAGKKEPSKHHLRLLAEYFNVSIDYISNRSIEVNVLDDKRELEIEQQHLEETITRIKDRTYYISDMIQDKSHHLKEKNNAVGDDVALRNSKAELDILNRALKEPFFGRFDIYSEEEGEETFYIGKQGVIDTEYETVVVDWRRPMASVFYNFTPGQSKQSYVVVDEKKNNKKTFTLDVLQKREFTINNSKIVRVIQQVADLHSEKNKTFTDKGEQITVTDDFLREMIENTETTGYLKEIIATIQHEQNIAIRQPISKNVIIQGVAGSGKSSIALHRLSFLLYNNKNVRPQDVLILGPSNMFISSYKDLLPELDLEGITQYTFSQLAESILKGHVTKVKQNSFPYFFENVLFNAEARKERQRIAFKGSESFSMLIDSFIVEYKKKFKERFSLVSLWGERLEAEDLLEVYDGYAYLPFSKRVSKFIEHVEGIYKRHLDHKIAELNEQFEFVTEKYLHETGFSNDKLGSLKKDMLLVFQHKKHKLQTEYKEFVKNWKKKMSLPNPISLYQQILSVEVLTAFHNEKDSEIIEAFRGYENKEIDYFDLAPLLYFYLSFYDEVKRYAHIVIDEAQDFSYLHFAVIKQLTKTMTILGDKDQSIFMDYGQNNWDVVKSLLFDQSEDQLLNMDTSYRSTTEIIEAANTVLTNQRPNRQPITSINRSGPAVSFNKVANGAELIQNILEVLEDWKTKYKRIAIIHKDEQKAEKLANYLQKEFNKDIAYVKPDEEMKPEPVSVIASYNSKGMEFDAVVIVNVNEETFPKDDFHARLLYVLLTRAQQEVTVFYQDTPSQLLDGLANRKPVAISRFDDIL